MEPNIITLQQYSVVNKLKLVNIPFTIRVMREDGYRGMYIFYMDLTEDQLSYQLRMTNIRHTNVKWGDGG